MATGRCSLAVALCVAAVLTVLPICAAEGQEILGNPEIVHESIAASTLQEDQFEESATSPMELVEEATEMATREAFDDLESDQVKSDINRVMRDAVRRMVAKVRRRPYVTQAAARRAMKGLHSQITQRFVEQAAKQEAVKVAKQHAKVAAARAAANGASTVEQAAAARSTANRVAHSFAKIARNSGLSLARDELARQDTDTMDLMTTQTTAPGDTTADVSDEISKAATAGVSEAKTNAKAVAANEAAKAGLSADQTKKLESEASSAVKQAAGDLEQGNIPTTSGEITAAASSGSAAANADAFANGEPAGRVSVSQAAETGKEKATKAELSKYEAIAAEEKRKTRAALQDAAEKEAAAASYVNQVATNSLHRGLDSSLSTKNLKLAASKATAASQQVEAAVKDSVNKALRQKDRLNRANEKVEKAGAASAKEAQEKNQEARNQQFAVKGKREQTEKVNAKEIKVKKERANEAAHKAITHVVVAAGQKASRKVARVKASAIQKDFLVSACHRHAQHSMRLLGEAEKNKLADRGLSSAAQRDAELKVLTDNEQKVVLDVVSNAVRRQAHLASLNAKKHAAARGLSNADQLTAARKAWKKAEPEIKGYCEPAAKNAAAAEVADPGQAPEAIDEHTFVVKAVQTMKGAVAKACDEATGPLVIDGAKLAARHDADYNWQVEKGNEEAAKVCNATTVLFTQNAEVKSKEMVRRSFDETNEQKQKTQLFQQRIREDAEDKVRRAEQAAEEKTSERLNKQCERKTETAVHHAKNGAARDAVTKITEDRSKSAAKAASDKAYSEALADGLSEDHANQLGKEAYDKEYSTSKASLQTATGSLAPSPPSTPFELAQLHSEWKHYATLAQRKRAKEVAGKREAKDDDDAELVESEAAVAEDDADKVRDELNQAQLNVAAREIQVPQELLGGGDDMPIFMTKQDKEEKKFALVHAIATAVKSLHKLGGQLPSEVQISQLQAQLKAANDRIAGLEKAHSQVEAVDDEEEE